MDESVPVEAEELVGVPEEEPPRRGRLGGLDVFSRVELFKRKVDEANREKEKEEHAPRAKSLKRRFGSDAEGAVKAMRSFVGDQMLEMISSGEMDTFCREMRKQGGKGIQTLMDRLFSRYLDVDAKSVASKGSDRKLVLQLFAERPPDGWVPYDADAVEAFGMRPGET